mgnify:CR=1 FL=1
MQNVGSFGPLMDGMLIGEENLAELVRFTAINANRTIRESQEGYKRPCATRNELISKIAGEYGCEYHGEDVISALFSNTHGESLFQGEE